MKNSTTLSKLITVGLLSMSIVVVLFLVSENEMHRNNAFIRRYIPHPIEKMGRYELEFNSYYIAGFEDKTIYLGNVTAPLQIMRMDTRLENIETLGVAVDNMDLAYRRIKITVDPPYFYVADGTVSVIFRGKTKDWKAKEFSYGDAFFNQYAIMDSLNIGIATLSTLTNTNVLGLLEKNKDTLKVKLNSQILKKQIDGRFGSGGTLLYNEKHKQLIYPYYYRNTYEVVDSRLQHLFTGKTIDTISRAVLDIAHYSKNNQYKIGPKSILVNRYSCTYGDYLFVHSNRLGRYEDNAVLRSASIIDVYNITDNNYAFSFYLYHQPGEKLTEFRVNNNLLVAIVEDQVWLYRLKPTFFKML